MLKTPKKSLDVCLKAGVLLVSLSSGYGRALAGSCTGAGGSYLCGGTAQPGDDLTITRTLLTSLTVKTLPGFGIDTSITGGDAMFLQSTGNLNFIDRNHSNITGAEAGIVAQAVGSGGLSITTSGAVTGISDPGIIAITTGTNLTISTASVSGGTGGIEAMNLGSGATTITAGGPVTTGAGNGIFAQNNIMATSLTITAGNVSGGALGIGGANFGSGALEITANGTVTGAYGGIIGINSGTTFTITAANVSGGQFGIQAINQGSGPLTITTSGMVSGGAAGIVAYGLYGAPSTINIKGQVQNFSGSPGAMAIAAFMSPTTVNIDRGATVTGLIILSPENDLVNLAGTLNSDVVALGDGSDTFIRVGGSSFSGIADGGPGSDTLGFNNMGTVHASFLGSNYINFENIGIYGGSTTFTGDWVVSPGTTTIYRGNLYVDGSLQTTTLTVNRGGLLGGNGDIYGDVIVYGTISPGHSIGTLTVNGSVDFMPGSTYAVELAPGGISDLLRVNGEVTIDDARLLVSLRRALYATGDRWRILEARDGIHGRFSSIDTTFTSETLSFRQQVYGGKMDLILSRTPYVTFGDTENGTAVGAALDSILPVAEGDMAGLLINMDFAMDRRQIAATLRELSPEMYTSFPAAGLAAAGIFGEVVALRQQEIGLRTILADDEGGRHWNVWSRVLADWLDRDGANGVSGYTQESGGVVFGMDRRIGSLARAGMLLGYSDSDLSWDDPGHSGTVTGRHIGVYGDIRKDGAYLDGSAGFTSLENSGRRYIDSSAFTASAAGSFDSSVLNGSLTGGYDFAFAGTRLGPIATISYQYLDQDGFTENGAGDFSLRVGGVDAESLTAAIGARLLGSYGSGQWRFLPHGGLHFLHQFKDDAVDMSASFVDYPAASFTATGLDPVENSALVGLGLAVEYGVNLQLYLDYSAALADEETGHLLSGGLAWKF
ncbi:MAG: autotransporter domain-containing protein [Desulforhopalus sp.]|nr:autotransporter domain-containing protein [Desulforhopalus sp.]